VPGTASRFGAMLNPSGSEPAPEAGDAIAAQRQTVSANLDMNDVMDVMSAPDDRQAKNVFADSAVKLAGDAMFEKQRLWCHSKKRDSRVSDREILAAAPAVVSSNPYPKGSCIRTTRMAAGRPID